MKFNFIVIILFWSCMVAAYSNDQCDLEKMKSDVILNGLKGEIFQKIWYSFDSNKLKKQVAVSVGKYLKNNSKGLNSFITVHECSDKKLIVKDLLSFKNSTVKKMEVDFNNNRIAVRFEKGSRYKLAVVRYDVSKERIKIELNR